MLGRLKAAVTRKIRGTAVGKQPVEVDAKYQEELNRAMRSLARRPRRSPSNTGKRAPRYRASYAKVADGLNARGIPDPRGKAWTRSAVHRYLQKNLPGLIQHRKASPSNSSSRRRRTKGVKGESR
ncbi:MAG: recombinase family protein [Pirellulaceae bacterium]